MSHVVSPMRDKKGIVRTLDYRSIIRTLTDPGQVARIGAGVRTMLARADPEDRILRLPEVLRLFRVSRSAWYQGIAEGRFPAGIRISKREVERHRQARDVAA